MAPDKSYIAKCVKLEQEAPHGPTSTAQIRGTYENMARS